MKDPDKWAPFEERMLPGGEMVKPSGIKEEDTLPYEMGPGDVLWNTLLTPHWVEATDHVAYSINLSHGGLRLNGELCRNEQELVDHNAAQKEKK
ncbi:MAG TPA: hypothetical protein DIU35_18590 [Candidatus Latescibacteria bacterium]|nr:hypothetical protein [Candidatus Latescibacterota bacterium]